MERKKAFISYAHVDGEFVETLAHRLNAKGVPIFLDKWDVQPGDSIVRRIFEEGLAQADLFLIVLSKASVQSRWVRDELDAATVRRIEGVTRVIPLLKEDCEIPVSLRHLMWLDMRHDLDDGIRKLVNIAYGVTDRPPLGPAPEHVLNLAQSVGGLSRPATAVGLYLLRDEGSDEYSDLKYSGEELAKALDLRPEELNDAVDELKERGLVSTIDFFGTHPYDFGLVGPTYALYLHLKDILRYDPEADAQTVAAAVVALGEADGKELQERTGLPPGRLNRAVKYLEDYGRVRVTRFLGTVPFSFGTVTATRHTRELVHR